jgi:3-oxoacyl-[acyl-carrier-protein] synthase II
LQDGVVITGMGIVTGLGVGTEATVDQLRRGEHAFGVLESFDAGGYEVDLGVEAPDPFEAHPGLPARARRFDRTVQHLLGTVDQALRSAGLAGGVAAAPERCDLILGSTLVAMRSAESYLRKEQRCGAEVRPRRPLAEYPPEVSLYRVANAFDLRGFHTIVSNACASGAAALQVALDRLRGGEADLVVAGGYDPFCEYTHAGFGSLMLLSRQGCRPFQAGRDGMLLGEAYGILILERAADAEARGAPVQAVLCGAAATADGYHLTQPQPEGAGAARCMQAALDDAGLTREAIGYVNLHGTGTPFNDLAEYRALATVFGDRLGQIPASSTKSFLGHTLGAAGAIEVIVSVLALQHGFAPPTLHVDAQDPETLGLDVLAGGAIDLHARYALSNSFGFGGANATVIVGRP